MSFDLLAPHYRWLEFVLAGDKLQRCRTAFLCPDLKPANVLVVGEGNGRFLAECARTLSSAKIVCVDSSRLMLNRARRRLARAGVGRDSIQFVQADVLRWVPQSRAFDLIVTHFFLDCFQPSQLETVLQRLAVAARPSAHWLLADFQIPKRGLERWRSQLIHWLMYAFFRAVTKLPARQWTAPDPWLNRHGFKLKARQVSEWGLLRSDWWQRA